MPEQVIAGALGAVLSALILGAIGVLFLPKALLYLNNRAQSITIQSLSKAQDELVKAVTRTEAAKKATEDAKEELTIKYNETIEALAEVTRDHRELRQDFDWVKQEFYRVTGTWPIPRPGSIKLAGVTP